jgi:hypothetical protein
MGKTTTGGSTVSYVNEDGNPVTVSVTTTGEHLPLIDEVAGQELNTIVNSITVTDPDGTVTEIDPASGSVGVVPDPGEEEPADPKKTGEDTE